MGHIYTPGLKVAEYTRVSKRRILPLKGEGVVGVGDIVDPQDVVARTELPGNVDQINATNLLGGDPEDLHSFLVVDLKQPIKKGDIFAQN